MSKLIHSISKALALADIRNSARESPNQPGPSLGRPDCLTAKSIEVSFMLKGMLADSAASVASAYRARQAVEPAAPQSEDPATDHVSSFPFGQGELSHAHRPLRSIGRPDALTAQHVEVAIVLNAMLGRLAANDYLVRHEVDVHVIERVLNPAGRRRGNHDASGIRI